MEINYANRMSTINKSFIREILKVTNNPEIISFAGGLPNARFFPMEAVNAAAQKVLSENGASVLQYSTSEGYLPLREYIANRYQTRFGMNVHPDEILITNGSQQCLDLLAKVFIDKGDVMIMEEPGYLGAIQAFSVFQPTIKTIPLMEDGCDTDKLEEILEAHTAKLFYTVTNFQNPSGISYSKEKRQKVAEIMSRYATVLVEDDPYGELRFTGEHLPYIGHERNGRSIFLGSFSKIIAPGMRLGWICAPKDIMDRLVTVKQAADLHSNGLSQRVIYQYLSDNAISDHVAVIQSAYGEQQRAMVEAIEQYFPKCVTITKPEGGMFLWGTLPEGTKSLELFNLAIKRNVAFVPGNPFYVDGREANTFRLNFSNCDKDQIVEGIKRLAEAMNELL